jgi:hypothetical protein
MNLLTTLKKMQHAHPDAEYAARSRRIVLNIAPPLSRMQLVGRWVLSNIESGASLALAGLCLFLVFAGFSLWKSFSPLGIARLDLASLQAEAQAIDIQIKLNGLLQYEGSPVGISPAVETTAQVAAPAPQPQSAPSALSLAAPESAIPTPSAEPQEASSTPTLSIDEALFELSR